MNLRKSLLVMLAALAIATFFSAKTKPRSRNRIDENGFPRIVLWAWERPEDLSAFDPQRFAVAFLAQTLILKGDDVVLTPRRQPLKVPLEAKLIAGTLLEVQNTSGERPASIELLSR